jgi:hypothetical protein
MSDDDYENRLTVIKGWTMKTEKRRAPREEKDIRISVMLDQREMPANLANISRIGALLRIESAECCLSELDVGKSISLIMEAGESQIRHQGTICRFTEDGPRKYLGVDFNHHLLC